MEENYIPRSRKVVAIVYDGQLAPVKKLLGISDAKYDQHERTFFVDEELMVNGEQGVLEKGQVIFKNEEEDKFVICDKAIFDKFYEKE